MLKLRSILSGVVCVGAACSISIGAQWPAHPIRASLATPRATCGGTHQRHVPDGKPDFSGVWQRANSGPPRGGGAGAQGRGQAQGQGQGQARGQGQGQGQDAQAGQGAEAGRGAGRGQATPAGGGGDTNAAFGGGRGGVRLEPPRERFPFDPKALPSRRSSRPAATAEEGGLPCTPWAAEIRKQRFALNARQPGRDVHARGLPAVPPAAPAAHDHRTPGMILIEYEGNYGIRHIYLDGRKLPPGRPQP